jgi:hypothetical protein
VVEEGQVNGLGSGVTSDGIDKIVEGQNIDRVLSVSRASMWSSMYRDHGGYISTGGE